MESAGSYYQNLKPPIDFSDCESVVSEPDQSPPSIDGALVAVPVGDKFYRAIERKLILSLASRGFESRIHSIRRVDYTFDHPIIRARISSFAAYRKAVGNVKYAWVGATKDEIHSILIDGFGSPNSDGTHGKGVYLSPIDLPAQSLHFAIPDDDEGGGLRHMLICRLIMGNPEVVLPGSVQSNPSSEEFDCGVDRLESPLKYIVWTSRMNSYILPEFYVTFRTCACFRGIPRRVENRNWMPLENLIAEVSKYIPSDAYQLILKHHSKFKMQRITRFEMIQKAREIAGDQLLGRILKASMGKTRPNYYAGSSCLDQLNRTRV